MPAAKMLPSTRDSLVLRVDFSDDLAWRSICTAIQAPVGEFRAYVDCVSDRAFEGIAPADLPSLLPEPPNHTFVFAVDQFALASPDQAFLVVDLSEEPGRCFRVVPHEAWSVQNNLSIANMDFRDFADCADADGVFRGFPPHDVS